MNKILKAIVSPTFVYYYLTLKITKIYPTLLPDSLILSAIFYFEMGRKLNLRHPSTFNEKLQWLKIYNRCPEYTTMVDKLAAKNYVANLIGERYIIPTLGAWSSFDQIDFDKLPNQFVLKTTHDSGSVIICKDKMNFDKLRAREVLTNSLHNDFYLQWREWPYKNVPRRIIAEKFMVDSERPNGSIIDYKFTCFDGHAENVMACYERETGDTKYYFFDRNWNLLRLNKRGMDAPQGFTMPKPTNIDEMFYIAGRLSEKLPYARIDLYEINGQIYFSEITFFPDSGLDLNLLPETDKYYGNKIKLPVLNNYINLKKKSK